MDCQLFAVINYGKCFNIAQETGQIVKDIKYSSSIYLMVCHSRRLQLKQVNGMPAVFTDERNTQSSSK